MTMTISTETDKERRAEFSARRSWYRDEQPETKTLGIADEYFFHLIYFPVLDVRAIGFTACFKKPA